MVAEEIFDVCDAQDNVIGQAPRAEVHAQNLLHRAVHIWVFNTSGELLVHRRSMTKDQYPDCFTSSASGHVDAGEDYQTAAHRELQEELGLSGDLEFIVKLPAGAHTAFEHTVLYALRTNATPQPNSDEIASIAYEPVGEVIEDVNLHPDRYTPPFRELAIWWDEHQS